MSTDPSRIKANLENIQGSKGPSESGKIQSWANSPKHDLTGQGVVLSGSNADKVAKRREALTLELQPISEMGRFLVGRMAVLMIRIEREAEHETASIAIWLRHAAKTFDHKREDAVDALVTLLGTDSVLAVGHLRRTPEGVARMLELWGDLRKRLVDPDLTLWGLAQADKAGKLTGREVDSQVISRIRSLTRAVMGDIDGLGMLDGQSPRAWTRDLLRGIVDEEISELEGLLKTFDYDQIARDRVSAGDRAYFDHSKEAALMRKYAAENSRLLAQVRKEFQEVQARALAVRTAASRPPKPPLGSFLHGGYPAPVPAAPEAGPEAPNPLSPLDSVSEGEETDRPPRS